MKLTEHDLDEALDELRLRKYTVYRYGADPDGPEIFAAVFRWREQKRADAVIFRSRMNVAGFRAVLKTPLGDPFKAERVDYFYQAPAEWAMRAMLGIQPPGHPDAPRFEWVLRDRPEMLSACTIPPEIRRLKRSIRPPMRRATKGQAT